MLSWQESLSHDTKHVRSYRELSNIHTILPFPPQLACNLIYLVTLQPPLSAILPYSTMQIVTDITRCITTIILTLINEPLQSYSGTSSIEHLLNYGRYDDNTEERYLLLCEAVPTCQRTMCCCLTVSGSDSIYPCALPCRGLFPYRIEPYILRQCLFSLILFIWF